jgi:hypothetical protein
MESFADPASPVPLHFSTTTISIEASSSCDVEENQNVMETSNPVVQCRNRKSSLMDDLENEESDNTCEADCSFLNDSTDEASPGEVLLSETLPLVENERVKTIFDQGVIAKSHEKSDLASQAFFTLRTSSSSKSSTDGIESEPPILPHRSHLPTNLVTGFSTSQSLIQTAPNWDNFVRSGSRLKSMIVDAIGEVKQSLEAVKNQTRHNKRGREGDDERVILANQRNHVVSVADFSAELAREKTAEVFQLKRVRYFFDFFDLA